MESGCQVADPIGKLGIAGNIVLHLWHKIIPFSSVRVVEKGKYYWSYVDTILMKWECSGCEG